MKLLDDCPSDHEETGSDVNLVPPTHETTIYGSHGVDSGHLLTDPDLPMLVVKISPDEGSGTLVATDLLIMVGDATNDAKCAT